MFTNIYVSKHQFQRFLMIQAGGSTLIRYGLKMDNNDVRSSAAFTDRIAWVPQILFSILKQYGRFRF